MKKIFTLALSLAVGTSLFADSLQIFKCSEDGIPGMTEPQLMGFSISANGRYICGAIEQGGGVFIADCETGEVKWKMADEAGGELRSVDNAGSSIGFLDDDGVVVSFETLGVDILQRPEGVRGILGESLSNDGRVKVGSFTEQSFNTVAAFSSDGSDWSALPSPTDAELGNLKDHINKMSTAKVVSGDGKVILGHLGSFTFPIIWKINDAGEYLPDFFPARYVKASDEDIADDSKELYGLPAFYTAMSNNGKYVGGVGTIKEESGAFRIVPVIYNTEDKSIKLYKEYQDIDYQGLGLYPRAIADDGTFIGTIGEPFTNSIGSFIMRAGEETAELFVDAFPAYAEMLGPSDIEGGMNVPTGISADGSSIVGYTYYSENLDIYDDSPAYYLTYVIHTGLAGVDGVSSDMKSTPEAVYSIDGRSMKEMTKGINIVRKADGTVSKLLK
ncbi:MAG: hypothetical protein K2N48_02210 [Muribaculaceae bacterium]|nr:hypothetical protein [Muribaculaceae bacterium]